MCPCVCLCAYMSVRVCVHAHVHMCVSLALRSEPSRLEVGTVPSSRAPRSAHQTRFLPAAQATDRPLLSPSQEECPELSPVPPPGQSCPAPACPLEDAPPLPQPPRRLPPPTLRLVATFLFPECSDLSLTSRDSHLPSPSCPENPDHGHVCLSATWQSSGLS